MKKGLILTIIIVVMGMFTSCGNWGGKAEFQASSLTITPNGVMAGEKVTVSVDVANIGSKEGTYEGTLYISEVKVGTRSITVPPGGKETLSFALVPPAGGVFNIGVNELKGVLVVREGVELGYDDGRPDDPFGISILGPGSGYLVKFSPPIKPFTITKVKIYGSLYGDIYAVQKFQVQIWDENQEIIYDPPTYPYTTFSPTPAWVELDVGNVRVNGDFYVHVCTNSTDKSGVKIFYDSSVTNTNSDVTENWKVAAKWYVPQPKEKVNWMIRVDGTIIGTTKKPAEQPTTP
jgi:hypothetical protein